MKLIAQKPCSFNGKKFFIGDEVPTEFVLNPKEQEKFGVLAIAADGAEREVSAVVEKTTVDTVTINVPTEEGLLPLTVTTEGIQAVFSVVCGKASEAEDIINQMTDGDALILLHICDSRKSIKAAAEARAKEINAEEVGEQ